jgi:anti-sigma regulatory factor (Ser/Thr protein kinase)
LSLVDRYAVTLRWVTALASALFCLLGDQVSRWQIPICLAVMGWSGLRLTQRRRPTTTVFLALDLAVVCAVGLTTPLTTSLSGVVNQTGLGISVTNPASLTFVWRPRRSTAALLSLTVSGCYLIGASMVPGVGAPWTLLSFYLLPIQAVVSRALVEIVLRAARAADRAAADRLSTDVDQEVAVARRAAEREHWAVLHDTAASTLLMVGDGVPETANDRIREQAGRDLATLDRVGREIPDAEVNLVESVRHVVSDFPLEVNLQVLGSPVVPKRIEVATIAALAEVLTNVVRHAEVQFVSISIHQSEDGFDITITDTGVGFDPADVGVGLRESVIGSMSRVGGTVAIDSTPGHGASVRIRWHQT